MIFIQSLYQLKILTMVFSSFPPNFFSGEGGIRTLGSQIGYSGFRDRPDRPLRHLSNTDKGIIAFYRSDFYAGAFFGVVHIIKTSIRKLPLQRFGSIRVAVHQIHILE